MADQLVIDFGPDGGVRVGTALCGELTFSDESATLSWPLDGGALEDLRWYLEDYLIAPYGVYEDRGVRIAEKIDSWGRAVFDAVFGAGPARDAYLRMRAHGEVELVLRSDVPSLLGLPWELMADPARDTPLALDIAGMSRSLLVLPEAAETVPVPGGRLRVLMVISRPAGTEDVGYRMIARPLLDRLEAVRGTTDLVVLRPPTIDALRGELAAAAKAGTPYQVVHFDGHGAFLGPNTADGGEGVLVFEGADGGPHYVPARTIARVLADAKVPVVVLNACQSAAVGKELEAAIATRLLREGVASVVAMAYSVYAIAAAEFMSAFYEQLFAGGTAATAVTAGRQQLYRTPSRPSPKGDLPLADWLVPVHYFRRQVSFPQALVPRLVEVPSLVGALAELTETVEDVGTGELDAVGGVFVGRDALFYDLEVATRMRKVVVLVGPGGTGKTELAKAFGRWWRDTGGVERPDWVFWHSFEPGLGSFGLDGVINEIGIRRFDTHFATRDKEKRRELVLDFLTEHRALLIWDNFESVFSLPNLGWATSPLDDEGCAELRDFLARLAAHSKTSVLITSRTQEQWLGDVYHLHVGGLAQHEAVEYAEHLLSSYRAARARRGKRAFGDLMQWLNGHPLGMRLVLPSVRETDPAGLLAELRQTASVGHQAGAADGRTSSLEACVGYSYAHLTEKTRRLLPVVSLFRDVADADVLGLFSAEAGLPDRFAGTSKEDWISTLVDAARVGLLTQLSDAVYQIHPALPGYLAAIWRSEESDAYESAKNDSIRALLTAHAVFGDWLTRQIESDDAGFVHKLISLERYTLGNLLEYALSHELWSDAQAIAQPLVEFWLARGLDTEVAAWIDRTRVATETVEGRPPRLDTPVGDLWEFIISVQIHRDLTSGHLDKAERGCMEIMNALQEMDPRAARAHQNGNIYYVLGRVAQDRRRPSEAEEWYRRALAVEGGTGDSQLKARTYHQMGTIAEEHHGLSVAEEWYRRSLAVERETGNRQYTAKTYHQLGIVTQKQGRLGEAEDWYRKALAAKDQVGDRTSVASTYHQLGSVAYMQNYPDEAEEWCRKALVIREELGDRLGLAKTYQQLGIIAHGRGNRNEAEEWYRKALAIAEEVDDRAVMALTYGVLALLAKERGQLPEALDWTVKSVALFDEFPHPATGPVPMNLARYTKQLGMAALEDAWRRVKGNQLPRAVRQYVAEHLRQGEGQ